MKRTKIFLLSFVAIIILVGTPFLIHFFSPQCSSEISADGLLGYIIEAIAAFGTVSLAAVTVWQNKRQKGENDVAQKRLEALTIQANEQYAVGKIIECESTRIARLKSLIQDFSLYCNSEQICALVISAPGANSNKAKSALSDWHSKLLETWNSLILELNNDPCTDIDAMVTQCTDTVASAEALINVLYQSPFGRDTEIDNLKHAMLDFIEKRNSYLAEVDKNFSELVYGSMTLSEIREKYKPKHTTEENSNG